MIESIGSPPLWAGFICFVLLMLALDLGIFHRRTHEISIREGAVWTLIWIALALVFNAWVAIRFGGEKGLEFFTGYLIEKALSVDNLFVFVVIFSYFGLPARFQHRVLFWGILGALIMRAAFILTGAVLLQRFHWIIFVFGAFLVVTGLRITFEKEAKVHPDRNIVVRLFRKMIPMTHDYGEGQWTLRKDGVRYFTPLLLVLLVVETTDVIFAVDSIPAIFAVTSDPFIVFTSNIFAILGLRALFFLLSGAIRRFSLLHVGLGLVLAFVGVKMLLSDVIPIPIGASLGVIALLLGGSVLASLLRKSDGR